MDLFGQLLGVANQNQAGQIQGQQMLRQILAQQQAQRMALRKESFDEMLKQAQTGEAGAHTALYQRKAQEPQLGDPGYAKAMGDVSAAQAAAEWPYKEQALRAQLENNLTLERARGATEAQIAAMRIDGEKQIEGMRQQNALTLQGNQQSFTNRQNALNRQNQQTIDQQNIQGRLQGIRQTQSGQLLPQIENLFGAGPLANPPVSSAPRPAPASSSGPKSIWDMEQP